MWRDVQQWVQASQQCRVMPKAVNSVEVVHKAVSIAEVVHKAVSIAGVVHKAVISVEGHTNMGYKTASLAEMGVVCKAVAHTEGGSHNSQQRGLVQTRNNPDN